MSEDMDDSLVEKIQAAKNTAKDVWQEGHWYIQGAEATVARVLEQEVCRAMR